MHPLRYDPGGRGVLLPEVPPHPGDAPLPERTVLPVPVRASTPDRGRASASSPAPAVHARERAPDRVPDPTDGASPFGSASRGWPFAIFSPPTARGEPTPSPCRGASRPSRPGRPSASLPFLQHRYLTLGGRMPRMRDLPPTRAGGGARPADGRGRSDAERRRGGRRGLRTSVMVTVARSRIDHLFKEADEAGQRGAIDVASRYVRLARRVGTRYNVRIPPELRARFCRGCLTYLREGTTARTRLRAGRKVRTCLRCGRSYRFVFREARPRDASGSLVLGDAGLPIGVPVDELAEEDAQDGEELDGA